MFLTGYRKELTRGECDPSFQSLHCIAHLDEDISEVLPYLNAEMGGFQFSKETPSLTLKVHGKLITLYSHKIAINAVRDEEEADKVLEWLKHEINETWKKRNEIKPLFETLSQPQILEVLKLLPKTNCRECGQPTCMVFAIRVTEGAKGPEDCPQLNEQNKKKLHEYLGQFHIMGL